MSSPLAGLTLTVAADGFTVNGVADLARTSAFGIAVAWGDGYMSQFRSDDPTFSHVYAKAGTYEVIAQALGYQLAKQVTTTANAPVPANRFPGTPDY